MNTHNRIRFLPLLVTLLWLGACTQDQSHNRDNAGLFPIVTTGVITRMEDQSLYVRGFKFAIDGTTINLGENQGNASDLNTGMVVTVSAAISLDDYSGTANSIAYQNLVEGPIDAINIADNTIQVLGQTVSVDELTVFQDTTFTELLVGDYIEVSGFLSADGIDATFIKLNSDAPDSVIISGTISNLDTVNLSFTIGDMTVDYSKAVIGKLSYGDLQDGLTIEISGTVDPVTGILAAATINIIPGASVSSSDGPTLGNDNISIIDLLPGASISDRPEVQFVLDGFLDHLNIEAGTLTVNGLTLSFSTNTLFSSLNSQVKASSINDFFTGDAVKVAGYEDASGKLMALSLTLLPASAQPDNLVKLTANIEELDQSNLIIRILGLNIQVTVDTVFHCSDAMTSCSFAQLQAHDAIEVIALLSDGAMSAVSIDLLAANPSTDNGVSITDKPEIVPASDNSESSATNDDEHNGDDEDEDEDEDEDKGPRQSDHHEHDDD